MHSPSEGEHKEGIVPSGDGAEMRVPGKEVPPAGSAHPRGSTLLEVPPPAWMR